MPEVFDYATIRVVPSIERGEFVNVGVIVACPTSDFLDCRLTDDLSRVAAIAPGFDLEVVAKHLEALRRVCVGDPRGGPIATLPFRERYHWLIHPRSTIVQTSPIHSGHTDDPRATLDRLFDCLARPPDSAHG